jgi:hypothetical protein
MTTDTATPDLVEHYRAHMHTYRLAAEKAERKLAHAADRIAALEKELAEANDTIADKNDAIAQLCGSHNEKLSRAVLAETSRDNALKTLELIHYGASAACNVYHANADDSLVRQKYALALHDIAALTQSAKDTGQ